MNRYGVWAPTAFWLVAGVLCYVLAFPPMEWGTLAWLAPLCWFHMLEGRSARQRFYLMLVTGYATSFATLYWLWPLFRTLTLILLFVPSLYFAAWGVMMRLPLSQSRIWRITWPAVLWCGLEHLRGEWAPLSFSWIALGYSQVNQLGSLVAPVIGVYGISALMVFWAALLLQWEPSVTRMKIARGCVLMLPIALACGHQRTYWEEPARTALLHQLREQDEITDVEEVDLKRSPDFIVWPEYILNDDPFLRQSSWFLDIMKREAAGAKHGIIFGASDYATSDTKRGAPFYNTAYMLDREGNLAAKAVKNKPIQLLPDGQPAKDITIITLPGTGTPGSPTEPIQLGVGICYDGSFQQFSRRMAARGASVLCFPTCNMEAWGPVQHRQHQRMFQMRAAETRLPVLTAAVSGPTFAAAPGGAVLKELPFHKTGTLLVSFAPSNSSTLFTLGGWLMGPLCTFAVCAALAFFVITRMVMPRMSNRHS